MFHVRHAVPITALDSINWLGFIIFRVCALYQERTTVLYIVHMQVSTPNVKPNECYDKQFNTALYTELSNKVIIKFQNVLDVPVKIKMS